MNTPSKSFRVVARRLALLAFFWWALTGGQWGAVWFVAPVLVAAALAPLALPAPASAWQIHPWGLLRFIPYFLRNSIKGGLDVAWRALSPVPALNPGLYHHELNVSSETARIFLAHVVSLLPGTLSAELEGRRLTVHALAGTESDVVRDLQDLERRVNGLFRGEAATA